MNVIGFVISAMLMRSHCSAASVAIVRILSNFTLVVFVCIVITGIKRETPSSLDFSIIKSVFDFFKGAKANQRSGSVNGFLNCCFTSKVHFFFEISLIVHIHSPSHH